MIDFEQMFANWESAFLAKGFAEDLQWSYNFQQLFLMYEFILLKMVMLYEMFRTPLSENLVKDMKIIVNHITIYIYNICRRYC